MEETVKFDRAALLEQATAIRDAIRAKSVTAEMVGSLFVALIASHGDLDDKVTDLVASIAGDIAALMEEANSKITAADSAAQRAEAQIATMRELADILSSGNVISPTALVVKANRSITYGNPQPQRIKAVVLPAYATKGVLFLGDNKAVEVTPDGIVTPLALGESTVNAVANGNTALYKTLRIAVVKPKLIRTRAALLIGNSGNFILT